MQTAECYGHRYGRLDECHTCEYANYCRDAADPPLMTNISYDDVAYSEQVSTPQHVEQDSERIYTRPQMCEVIRRLIELDDQRVRDIVRLRLIDPDMSLSEIASRYDISKQAIQQYMKRALAYCPELAVIFTTRPLYNRWRAHVVLTYPKRKKTPLPFVEQLKFDFPEKG